ncbi:MAG TPA: 50S ribosomal protein L18 [Thermoanaerobaculia bacterium]|nr:50S ribosomal protein L18 [Thermoanaerobaculia bacterium]
MSDHITKQMKRKRERRERAHLRVRTRVRGTGERPRLSIYKSARYIYAQVIDDSRGVTLVQANSADPEVKNALSGATEGKEGDKAAKAAGTGSQAAAKLVGEKVAERAKAQGIAKVVFDRGGYIYHGKVKAVADGAREKGLEF